MPELSDLAKTIYELKDIEDIKQLKARYCHLVDTAAWDALDLLWAEDAICDYGFFGRFEGRAQIMESFFRGLVASVSSFNAHMLHNPIVAIDGDCAAGFWYLSAHTTIQPHNQAMWVQGFYRDKFVRLDERWKIAEIKVEFRYFTPFEEGWAKTPLWELPG